MAVNYKADFPIFSAAENKDVIYFDNAATTQRPLQVIEAIKKFYEHDNENPLRGLYDLSGRATEAYESARHTVATFIGAKDCEIIFTRNASESLNLVAYALKIFTKVMKLQFLLQNTIQIFFRGRCFARSAGQSLCGLNLIRKLVFSLNLNLQK